MYISVFPKTNSIAISVCDCVPGYVYFPATEKCFEPYTQAICKPNELFAPPVDPKNYDPKCVENQCTKGIWFEGECQRIALISEPDLCSLDNTKCEDRHELRVGPVTIELDEVFIILVLDLDQCQKLISRVICL